MGGIGRGRHGEVDAQHGLHQVRQLGLAYARRTEQMAHLAAHAVVFVVGVLKLHFSQMYRKCGHNHRNEHLLHVF